jgi:DNA-binding CsgD family transcriptional regulator
MLDAARCRASVAHIAERHRSVEAPELLAIAHRALAPTGALYDGDLVRSRLAPYGRRATAPRNAAVHRSASRTALSNREAQIVDLVRGGSTNIDIAASIGLTSGGVRSHLTRIYRKLGVTSRAQLAALDTTANEPVSLLA